MENRYKSIYSRIILLFVIRHCLRSSSSFGAARLWWDLKRMSENKRINERYYVYSYYHLTNLQKMFIYSPLLQPLFRLCFCYYIVLYFSISESQIHFHFCVTSLIQNDWINVLFALNMKYILVFFFLFSIHFISFFA